MQPIDISEIPFSRHGSFIAFQRNGWGKVLPAGLYWRTVRAIDDRIHREAFRLDVLREGLPIPFVERSGPEQLSLEAERGGGGGVDICFPEPDTLRFRGRGGCGLRLTFTGHRYYENAMPKGDGSWIVNCRAYTTFYEFTPLEGTIAVDAPWNSEKSERIVLDFLPSGPEGGFEIAVEEYRASSRYPDHRMPFDACVAEVNREFGRWLADAPEVRSLAARAELAEAREMAAYITWSSVVRAEGLLRRPGMLMSKRRMTQVWSWDNCFNAMALAYGRPEDAWDQLWVIADHQDPSGPFPDQVNDKVCNFNFCKPPVYGWTLRWMRSRNAFFSLERVAEFYGPLCRQTEWWFRHRDLGSLGIPHYNHGNDSGWDNGTVFGEGLPVRSPDLSAWLVVQMEELAIMAETLKLPTEADSWRRRAHALAVRAGEYFWDGTRLVARRVRDGGFIRSQSLLPHLALIMGDSLDPSLRRAAVAEIGWEGNFHTPWGLATESPGSPAYLADGYWRGPIWAPATFIAVEALRAAKEKEMARDLSVKFCRLCARHGFAENFDALTGVGLRDRPYTWTASVFLALAHEM